MDDRRLMYLTAFSINMFSFIITIYLLNKNLAIEGNPIMSFMFSYGILSAFVFLIVFWSFLYFIFIYLPEKSKNKEIWTNASKYSLFVLIIMISIDFFHDYIFLLSNI